MHAPTNHTPSASPDTANEMGALFGELRAALQRPPDRRAWAEVCAITTLAAELNAPRVVAEWVPYLHGALRAWPDALRVCPRVWLAPELEALTRLTRVVWITRHITEESAARLGAAWRTQPAPHVFLARHTSETLRALLPRQHTICPQHTIPTFDARVWIAEMTDPLVDARAVRLPPRFSGRVWRELAAHMPIEEIETLDLRDVRALTLLPALSQTGIFRALHTLDLSRQDLSQWWPDEVFARNMPALRAVDMSRSLFTHAPRHDLDTVRLHALDLTQVRAPQWIIRQALQRAQYSQLHTLGLRAVVDDPLLTRGADRSLGDALVHNLVQAPCVRMLRRLDLGQNQITITGLALLEEAGLLRPEVELDLTENPAIADIAPAHTLRRREGSILLRAWSLS